MLFYIQSKPRNYSLVEGLSLSSQLGLSLLVVLGSINTMLGRNQFINSPTYGFCRTYLIVIHNVEPWDNVQKYLGVSGVSSGNTLHVLGQEGLAVQWLSSLNLV